MTWSALATLAEVSVGNGFLNSINFNNYPNDLPEEWRDSKVVPGLAATDCIGNYQDRKPYTQR